jgi:hypothetical protein
MGSVFSAPSWAAYAGHQHRVIGVYKGLELIGGAVVYETGGGLLPIIPGTPWQGPISRSADEGECLAMAECLAQYLLRRYTDVTLTLPPEWVDVRGFTWAGMRSQVRYTYRGESPVYEKRVKFRTCFVKIDTEYHPAEWMVRTYSTADSRVDAVFDWRTAYYWKANEGGSYHTECANTMIRDAEMAGLTFDMVGCNSPKRGLFKRGFGGRLTPYFMVTTLDPKSIAALWPPQEVAVA